MNRLKMMIKAIFEMINAINNLEFISFELHIDRKYKCKDWTTFCDNVCKMGEFWTFSTPADKKEISRGWGGWVEGGRLK